MGRRGGPPHTRWVRGSVDRWLVGWVARAVGPVRCGIPLASGPLRATPVGHGSAHVGPRRVPGGRLYQPRQTPAPRSDGRNKLCRQARLFPRAKPRDLARGVPTAIRLPSRKASGCKAPARRGLAHDLLGRCGGEAGAGGGVGEGIERREIPSFTFFNPSFSAPFPPAREIAREECERRVRPQPTRVSDLLRQEFIHPP